MLCFAYHNPAILKTLLSEKRYNIISLFSDEDKSKIKLDKNKTNVLFCNSVNLLNSTYKAEKEKIKEFKIVLFDVPHNFFIKNYLMVDAENRTDGIWSFVKINENNFENMVKNTPLGLKGAKLIKESEECQKLKKRKKRD